MNTKILLFVGILSLNFIGLTSTVKADLVKGSGPRVYYRNEEPRTVCHVQNPEQIPYYGGFSAVTNVENLEAAINTYRNIGECQWPDGFFQYKGFKEVYRLFNGDRYCHVRNPEQMERFGGFSQVKIVTKFPSLRVGESEDARYQIGFLDAQRAYLGDCND